MGLEVRDDRGNVEALVGRDLVVRFRLAERHQVCAAERSRVVRLVDVASARVGPWLEHGPQPALGISLSDALDGFAYGRGMVRKVIDDEDAADLATLLLPPFHALERREAVRDLVVREAKRARRGIDSGRVLDIVVAGHREEQLLLSADARAVHPEVRALRGDALVVGAEV